MTTLVLNADYSPMALAPLSVLTWKEAVKLVWLEQIEVLEYYEDWYVHSPSVTLQVPSVVVSKTYVKTSRSIKFNKANLCIRDDYRCQYCGHDFELKSLTMDHVLPKSLGGKTNWTNIVMSCSACNTRKGHRTNMKPLKDPIKPSNGDIVAKARKMPIVIPNANWIPYIGWQPKLITIRKPSMNIDL